MNVTGDLMDPRDAGPLHSERTRLDSVDGRVFNRFQTVFRSTAVFGFVPFFDVTRLPYYAMAESYVKAFRWGSIRWLIRLSRRRI